MKYFITLASILVVFSALTWAVPASSAFPMDDPVEDPAEDPDEVPDEDPPKPLTAKECADNGKQDILDCVELWCDGKAAGCTNMVAASCFKQAQSVLDKCLENVK